MHERQTVCNAGGDPSRSVAESDFENRGNICMNIGLVDVDGHNGFPNLAISNDSSDLPQYACAEEGSKDTWILAPRKDGDM